MIDLLAILYAVGIQFRRGGWWYLILPVTLVALVVDVIANYTTLALLTQDFPRKGEWTFSTRLKRLCAEAPLADRGLYREIVYKLNRIDPTGCHIQL